MLADRTVAIIGAGNMAEALLRGAFGAGVLQPERCVVANKSSDERLGRVASAWNVRTTRDKKRLMAESDVIVLAVKPHDMPTVLGEIAPHARPRHLIVSVAAGVSLEAIERAYIMWVLQSEGGNKSRAAELLGISRPRLYRRIKELNLPDEPEPADEEPAPNA